MMISGLEMYDCVGSIGESSYACCAVPPWLAVPRSSWAAGLGTAAQGHVRTI